MEAPNPSPNVKEVVPFIHVRSMPESLEFYRNGLGFEFRHRWPADGEIRWCWLTLGGASIMLQTARGQIHPPSGQGPIVLCLTCEDALAIYRDAKAKGLDPTEPQVGNGLWSTTVLDPDGNKLDFESPTDVPEETKQSELVARP